MGSILGTTVNATAEARDCLSQFRFSHKSNCYKVSVKNDEISKANTGIKADMTQKLWFFSTPL